MLQKHQKYIIFLVSTYYLLISFLDFLDNQNLRKSI